MQVTHTRTYYTRLQGIAPALDPFSYTLGIVEQQEYILLQQHAHAFSVPYCRELFSTNNKESESRFLKD